MTRERRDMSRTHSNDARHQAHTHMQRFLQWGEEEAPKYNLDHITCNRVAKIMDTVTSFSENKLFCLCASLHTRDWLTACCSACALRCTLVIGSNKKVTKAEKWKFKFQLSTGTHNEKRQFFSKELVSKKESLHISTRVFHRSTRTRTLIGYENWQTVEELSRSMLRIVTRRHLLHDVCRRLI